ncbi:hypothetical protein TNCV_3853731 [Trichonephila clavipes]|nr:hypothetical protein TNCV_3853731 [Trichonephila clavipes]
MTVHTLRGIDSTSFWKRSTGLTCQILTEAVHNSVSGPIYDDRKIKGILIQPASSQLRLVRGTVAFLGNYITVRTTGHHKRMGKNTQQLYVPKCIEGDWYTYQRSQTVAREHTLEHDLAAMFL